MAIAAPAAAAPSQEPLPPQSNALRWPLLFALLPPLRLPVPLLLLPPLRLPPFLLLLPLPLRDPLVRRLAVVVVDRAIISSCHNICPLNGARADPFLMRSVLTIALHSGG